MKNKIVFTKKLTIAIILASFLLAPFANIPFFSPPKTAKALDGVQNGQLISPGAPEGDKQEWDCGTNGYGPGRFGSCVPIEVTADPNRGSRNTLKNILTAVLYGGGAAMGQWIAKKINDSLKIRDYYGYDRSVKDQVYRYRILFEKYLDPTTRRLVDISYDSVARGGVDYNRVSADVNAIARANLGFTPPSNSQTPRSGATAQQNQAFFDDPNFYQKLAMLGAPNTRPTDIYFNLQSQALDLQSEASRASALELGTSEGYKSTRSQSDLNLLKPQQNRPDSFYNNTGKAINELTGQIRTPGGYAAKAVQVAIQRLLNRDYLSTNVTYAAITEGAAWGFFKILNGGLFGGGTAAIGGSSPASSNPAAGKAETFYKDPNAVTGTDPAGSEDTNGSGNNNGSGNTNGSGNHVVVNNRELPNEGEVFTELTAPKCDSKPVNGMYTFYGGVRKFSDVYEGCIPQPVPGYVPPPDCNDTISETNFYTGLDGVVGECKPVPVSGHY